MELLLHEFKFGYTTMNHGISTFSDIQLPWCQSQVWNKEEDWWLGADIATVNNRRMKSNGR